MSPRLYLGAVQCIICSLFVLFREIFRFDELFSLKRSWPGVLKRIPEVYFVVHTSDIKGKCGGALYKFTFPSDGGLTPLRKLKWQKFQLMKCSKLVFISVTRPVTEILR